MKLSPFTRMANLSKEITLLESIQSVLGWDQETYMPEKAEEIRSEQLERLAAIIHKQKTSKGYQKTLSELIDLETGEMKEKQASQEEIACAKEWRRVLLQDIRLPGSFVKKFTRLTSSALPVWAKAKQENSFSSFAPKLEEIVKMTRKKAELLGYQEHPYDALLDLYDPGMTVAKLSSLFSDLKPFLLSLLQEIRKHPLPPVPDWGVFSEAKQQEIGQFLLTTMGFSKQSSRLDLSSHPFCIGIHPTDTRMTTRLDPKDPTSNIFSVIHEGGHGLYHAGLPVRMYGTPLCQAVSYGVDESQSRLWETVIGQSREFCSFLFSKLQIICPENFRNVDFESFYRFVNRVEASKIRVEADEVTYSLHVIVRFEIEKALIEGSLSVKDVPKVWKQKMQESPGVIVSSDSEGCLQDIHWAMGGIGYFPGYTLGSILAAQLFGTMQKEIPHIKRLIESGDFEPIRNWLSKNIHSQGKLYSPEELIKRATGKPLDSKDYMEYLKEKYRILYR